MNSFSANYDPERGSSPFTLINILYRIKKYQYLSYKHFLLHGLNIAVTVGDSLDPNDVYWRSYWLSLNTSYVMEFFLQTLVKRRHLGQTTMLRLNKLLMVSSSVAASCILYQNLVHPVFICGCLLSLVLNILRRGHDFTNTSIVAFVEFFLHTSW